MKTSSFKPAQWIIPLALLAFIGPGISFVNVILNTTTRWGVLAALSFFLLFHRGRDLLGLLRRPLFWMVMAYGLWGVATVAWSEVPIISLAKSLVFLWVVVAMLAAGYAWVMRHARIESCDFLWMMAIPSLLASLLGQSEENLDTGSVVYAGLTGNPNFLGFVLATSSVWLIWRAYRASPHSRRVAGLWLGLLALDVYYLLMSHSRASLLIFLFVAFGMALGLGKVRKWLPHALLAVALAGAGYALSPAVQEFVHQYTFKSSLAYLEEEGSGLWFSREVIWQESYDLAVRGGAFGGGYGVTIGEAFQGEIGTTVSSGQYGREQGNTQLAIVEQTGLIGFGLYLILILSILGVFASALFRAPSGPDKVAVGLLGGALTGLLVMSVFEAWWVAPGAAESATFWMLTGAMLAVSQRIKSATAVRKKPAPTVPITPNPSPESQPS